MNVWPTLHFEKQQIFPKEISTKLRSSYLAIYFVIIVALKTNPSKKIRSDHDRPTTVFERTRVPTKWTEDEKAKFVVENVDGGGSFGCLCVK